jgi:thiamine biosynthesis protein ThiI
VTGDADAGPPAGAGHAPDVERAPGDDRAVLIGYGDLGVKSRGVRTRMAERLRDHCAALLAARSLPGTVEREWARLVVRFAADAGSDPDAVARALADAFGAVWTRPAAVCAPTVDAVVAALVAVAHERPRSGGTVGPFAVRANRAGDHPFGARDLEVAGGRAIEAATGASVDLDDPAVVYRVDCRDDEAFVSATQYDGPGGLPLGTQGRVVALVSGGIDSPVAAYEAMRRGCEVTPLYVSLGDYGGPDHEARAVETVRHLARYAPASDVDLRVVDAGELVEDLVREVGPTRMLSLRRAMLAAAGAVADDVGAHAVVTGEVIGQKSSQTGPNLAVVGRAIDRPVHRPLVTRDKADVTAQARAIGTYDDSTLPVGCERVAPRHPETNATVAGVRAAEPPDLLVRARRLAADPRRVPLDD